ncbi:MAG: 4-hydroxy-tetrahydrodipicolinate synthase [Burkholderiaceae bacterium]|jgi:4-hydroxy-tetrahydrodipicolinate synthase|uniref:4-hydroxy-tetrahydrodipicolinate synthase n=1 Tax=Polynucleobacter sp. MWH-Loch1C5 TaxID=2689108 RepID=UPI001C0B971E|nr:4-hydroxy-tetrahydrodipicolinate synthase [Polynucleobacter sp. MWH-Loch1C5]MBU3543067.1 4-hydroxy-tetrahydrodipicolinate synthase [Polynucleobacter sp. MWH-Loch1C5]NBV00910.1 4-hydroxy-tetrahydrodipicolinate synthase [Burkholderiaceae bacterium]
MTKLAKNIQGSLVAIVTPMHADGSLDMAGLRQLIDWHIQEGTDGIVIVGTTGESPTVSVEEHCELIRVTVEHTKGRIPIIAGTGGNSTAEAIELTEYAKKVGADASLQVVPYYNKPTQEGMYQHFKTIAEKVDLPVILYNVPGRTVADMSNETVIRLAQVPGVIGIKDATGNLERGTQLMAGLKATGQSQFAVYSGDDPTALLLMFMGGQGNISVTANVAPKLMHELCVAAMAGDVVKAREIQYRLLPVHKAMFMEANPIPVKWALHAMGKMGSGIRLPLTTLTEPVQVQVRAALKTAGLL